MAKWFNNAAAGTLEQPQRKTEIHQTVQARHYGVEILMGVIAVIILFTLGWLFLTSIMDDAGYKVKDLVSFAVQAVQVILSITVVLLIIWIGSKITNAVLAEQHQRWKERQEEIRETLRIQHAIQDSASSEVRTIDPKTTRRNKLIIALMTDALLHNEYNFSYRKAGAYTLSNEDRPLGKDSVIVRAALEWLTGQGAIDNGNITTKFTSIGDVQRALYFPPLLGNSSGVFIE